MFIYHPRLLGGIGGGASSGSKLIHYDRKGKKVDSFKPKNIQSFVIENDSFFVVSAKAVLGHIDVFVKPIKSGGINPLCI